MPTPLVIVGRGYCASRNGANASSAHMLDNSLFRMFLRWRLNLNAGWSAAGGLAGSVAAAFATRCIDSRLCAGANSQTRDNRVHRGVDRDMHMALGVTAIARQHAVLARTQLRQVFPGTGFDLRIGRYHARGTKRTGGLTLRVGVVEEALDVKSNSECHDERARKDGQRTAPI